MAPLSRPRTGDQALVREINLSLIMNQLQEHAPISRATLAEITGLNKTTVSSLISELVDQQYVHQVGLDTSGVGRPAVLYELNPQAGCIIGAEIGVDFISVIRTNFAAEIMWQHKEHTDSSQGQQAIIERTLALLHQAVDEREPWCSQILGLAVGVPGLVDYHTGNLIFAPNLMWRDVPLGDMLRADFDIPVYVDNEANMAVLGEHYFGAAQGYNDVLYVSVGVGLGGGIVRGGAVFRGKAGFAGEFGHMTIQPNGRPCNCGSRGCWETVVSQSALFRYVRQAAASGRTTILTQKIGENLSGLTVPLIVEAADRGDKVSLDALARLAHYLGMGIASLSNAVDPELIVFGGILSTASAYLLPIVEQELSEHAISYPTNPTKVVLARHGSDACVMGGIATVYQSTLSQPGTLASTGGQLGLDRARRAEGHN